MKNLTFTPRRPTPERQKAAVEATKRKAAEKRYLKSVKFCQKCGKEVWPEKDGSYILFMVDDKERGALFICKECHEKEVK